MRIGFFPVKVSAGMCISTDGYVIPMGFYQIMDPEKQFI
jgi:hypothetical protein